MSLLRTNTITGLSGNELYCLHQLGLSAGNLCLGNSVIALGLPRGIGAALSNLAGGEVSEITELVSNGRKHAYGRLLSEAEQHGGVGLCGISLDLVNHGTNLEFIAQGSTVNNANNDRIIQFSTAASGQDLYCLIDSGFTPRGFVFGNVAYSIGVGGNIGGILRGLGRGEVPQYTEIFDSTRHLALTRIKKEAKRLGANSIIGIETSILPLLGAQEMAMMGTASNHPALTGYADDPITSDLTGEELWNIIHMGYMPIKLVLGVSVYSLGLTSSITSGLQSLVGGRLENLSDLLHEAREKALDRVEADAKRCNADKVVGVKTYIYDMGGGLVEFMAIGTAVKRMDNIQTKNPLLPAQAIIQDRETLVDSTNTSTISLRSRNTTSAARSQRGPLSIFMTILIIGLYAFLTYLKMQHQ